MQFFSVLLYFTVSVQVLGHREELKINIVTISVRFRNVMIHDDHR